MRESIGAAWITGVVVAFIALFSGYLALSINYSKAFKVKDGIIDRIEKHNGPNQDALNDIAKMLSDVGYNSKGACKALSDDSGSPKMGVNKNVANKHPGNNVFNYCVLKVDSYKSGGLSAGQLGAAYYRVVVFFSLSLPVVDQFANFWITGETRNLNYPEDLF